MSRFDPLRTLLESMGWEATPIELASDCWWAKEIWKHEEPNEAMVWAVGLSETFPTDRIEAQETCVAVNQKFQSKVSEISSIAAKMRTAN